MPKVVVVTVSDRSASGVYADVSGPTLVEIIKERGAEVTAAPIVPDEPEQIQALLRCLTDEEDVHLILTTGGTGPAPRDHIPEATKAVIEREMPGRAELPKQFGQRRTPWAVFSRGVAGIRERTLIINLPGNPRAVREGMEVLAPLLPPTVSLMRGGLFCPEMTAAECCEGEV